MTPHEPLKPIKLTVDQTKRWKSAGSKPDLELELLALGHQAGALVRDAKNSVLGRLTGGAKCEQAPIPGSIQQPAQRMGLPYGAGSQQPPQQPAQPLPPHPAPAVAAPLPAVSVPTARGMVQTAGIAKELRSLRELESQVKKLGTDFKIDGSPGEILGAVAEKLIQLIELEEALEVDFSAADPAAAPTYTPPDMDDDAVAAPAVEHSADGD